MAVVGPRRGKLSDEHWGATCTPNLSGYKMNRKWVSQLSELLVGDSTGTGLFRLVNKSDQTFYINRHSKELLGDDHLTFYFAAGQLLGKGLLDGTQWGFHLATPLLKIILGQPVSFTDLQFFDPEEFKNLNWLSRTTAPSPSIWILA